MANSLCMISSSTFQIKLFRNQFCPLRSRFLHHRISHLHSSKVLSAKLNDPEHVKLQMNVAKERLKSVVPEPVKEFPWKKAEDHMIRRMFSVGKTVLNWSAVALFVIGFCSDFVFSVASNLELLVPFGLFVGCFVVGFLNETFQVLFHDSQEERGLSWRLVGIACFLVLVKFISTYVALRGHIFLLNFSNGGLMQVLWLWKRRHEEESTNDARKSTSAIGTEG